MQENTTSFDIDRNKGNFHYDVDYEFDAGTGLTEQTIDYICKVKGEPDWICQFRKNALRKFLEKPMPTHWASKDLENIIFDNIRYYLSQGQKPKRSWDEVPEDVKRTFERLGIPEQERKFLAGVEAQFDSEAAYSNIKEAVGKQGVIFIGSTEGLKEHPEIFRKWFGKVIPTGDNKFSALNSAVFSGGSFIYVPPGVKVSHPLQAYFRINAENFGQFERTLIIADEGAEVTYMEGCTAPKFDTATLHSAVVELVALKGAKIQYITVQNWSNNVFNLVTKRGLAMEDAEIKWIDCNIGSRLTMKYPGVVMKGRRARGEVISIALAGDGQHQDTGAKMIHAADETTSNIVSKSISVGTGRATYRGLVNVPRHLKGCKNNTECDALRGVPITFTASGVDGDDEALQYSFNGGVFSATKTFTTTYDSTGLKLVSVQAKDASDYSPLATATVTILNRPPAVTISPSAALAVRGQQITFTASGADPDNDALQYSFNGGAYSSSRNYTTSYSTTGTKVVSVRVKDANDVSPAATAIVRIENRMPVVTISANPSQALKGQQVIYTAIASDPDNDVLQYSFNGTPYGSSSTFTTVYDTAGIKTVTVRTKDASDTSLPATAVVTVQ